MARISYAQTNFTAGEISPRLTGRTDIDRYANAVSVMQNAYPVIHGGAKRRAGTRFLQAAKYSGSKKVRLVPFVFSRDDAYMLEFGDSYVRVFQAGGAFTGIELATSYTESMLADMDYVQGADTMFLAHASVPIQRLRRLSASVWNLSAAPFTTTPFDEQGHTPAIAVTLSAATVGSARVATAASATFLPTDVGRPFLSGSGVGVVVSYTSSTVIGIDITVAFSSVNLLAGTWTLDLSPYGFLIPSAKSPVATSIDLKMAKTRGSAITLSAKTGVITVTSVLNIFTAGDVGKLLYADSGIALITVYTDAQHVTATTQADFSATDYASGAFGITIDGWQAGDVGKFVRVNGGLCKITSYGVATQVQATIVTALTSVVAAPPLSWTLEASQWSSTNGYPRTITLHEQRLVAAGTSRYPQTIWGSRIGEYLDFTKGTADDDAYAFTLANDEVNPISYLASLRNLVVHTYGGEFSIQGGIEKPITPTNVRIRSESPHGSRGVRPVTVGKESVFVQRAGRKIRAMAYRFDQDGYSAPDLTVLAEHITTGAITCMAFQQEPDLLLWCVRGDGALITCTIDREQQVTGWARHYTDGAFESVGTIPNGDREETWVAVKRTVNGVDVRFIELVDETFEPLYGTAATGYPPITPAAVYGFTVDCGLSFSSGSGMTTISLPHLEGKTVAILADGAVQASQVVPAGGSITLARSAQKVLAGLPFTTQVTLLSPEGGNASGTAQGNAMRTSELTLRFLDTLGAKIVDDEGSEQIIPFRTFGADVLDQPPEAQTRLVRGETLGWKRGSSVVSVIQEQPLPMHLLSAIRKFTVND